MKKHRGLGRGLDALIPNAMEEEHPQEEQQSLESEPEKEKAAAKPRTKKASAKSADTENSGEGIGEEAGKEVGLVRMVRTSKVEPDRNQPRKSFDKEKLQELAD